MTQPGSSTHCPDCFLDKRPAPRCQRCGFDSGQYRETASQLPLFTPLQGGRYVVGRCLGAGGFGIVYSCWDSSLHSLVALKEYFPSGRGWADRSRNGCDVTISDEGDDRSNYHMMRERFLREGRMLRRVHHLGAVVGAFDIFEQHSTAYLVMERLYGKTLTQHLATCPGNALSPPAWQQLYTSLLKALAALHTENLIHRDIKPDNIVLHGDSLSEIKLLDFGLARNGDDPGNTSLYAGTPGYMAPEQVVQGGQITYATDWYAFGAVMYRCATGAPPDDPPAPLSSLAPRLPPELMHCVDRCLRHEAARRPQKAADLQPVRRAPPRPTRRLAVVGPGDDDGTRELAVQSRVGEPKEAAPQVANLQQHLPVLQPQGPQQALPPARRRWPWGVACLLLLAGTVAAAWWWQSGSALLLSLPASAPSPVVTPMLTATAPPSVEPQLLPMAGGVFGIGDMTGMGFANELPPHQLDVGAFRISPREVTVTQFAAFIADSDYKTDAERGNGCRRWDGAAWLWDPAASWRQPGYEQSPMHPVVCVSWNDVQEYLRWLNARSEQLYRLPTEAEWEYAARAGGNTVYQHADSAEGICEQGNVADMQVRQAYGWANTADCDDRHLHAAPVGSYAANRYGLYDLHGNVWEWTCSAYRERYDGSELHCVDTQDSGQRVLRGGAFFSAPRYARSATRNFGTEDYRGFLIGFRVAADP